MGVEHLEEKGYGQGLGHLGKGETALDVLELFVMTGSSG